MQKWFENIGIRIRELRTEQNITQKELAEKTGIDVKTISAYERGVHVPTVSASMEISAVLKVSLEYLCGITDTRYNFLIPEDIELDLTKLNALGLKAICDYYKALCLQPEYVR